MKTVSKRQYCSKPVYVGTKSGSTFLSLVDKDLTVKNIVFTTNIHYL